MSSVIELVEAGFKKSAVVNVRSGDTVKVHQKIREGSKERVQIFQGLVIRTKRKGSHTSAIVVRRVANGVGVEKSFLLHSPLILKIEVVKRSKVRRNYLTYMRERTGKSARLTGVGFDARAVNDFRDETAIAEEEKIHEKAEVAHEIEAAKKAEAEKEVEAKVESIVKSHVATETTPEKQ